MQFGLIMSARSVLLFAHGPLCWFLQPPVQIKVNPAKLLRPLNVGNYFVFFNSNSFNHVKNADK